MLRNFGLTLVLVGATALLAAQSQPPPPTPPKEAQNEQHLRTTEQNTGGVEQTPIVSPKSTSQSYEGQADSDKNTSPSNWWYIIPTMVIASAAIVQAFIYAKQAGYMKRGLKATEVAADAAKVSADASTQALDNAKNALRLTERAVVLVADVEALGSQPPGRLVSTTKIFFTVKNYGRTVAYSVALSGELEVGGLLETNGTRKGVSEMAPATLASQADKFWNTSPIGDWMNSDLLAAINNGHGYFSYALTITYVDVFDAQHVHTATGRWNPAVGRFDFGPDTSD